MVYPPYPHRRTRSLSLQPDGQYGGVPSQWMNNAQPYSTSYQPAPPNPYVAPVNYAAPQHPPPSKYPPQANYAAALDYSGMPTYGAPTGYSPPGGYTPPGGFTPPSNGGQPGPFPRESPYTGYVSQGEWGYGNPRVRWDQSEQSRPTPKLIGMDFDKVDCHPLLKKSKGSPWGRYGTLLSGTATFDVRSRHIGTSGGDKLSNQLKAAPAFSIPQSKVRIFCRDLPWEIIVENSSGNITVGDVFRAIHFDLQKSLTTGEWFIASDKDRTRMSRTFQAAVNTEGSGRELVNGVKRVDYLGLKTRFEELKPAHRKDHDWAFSRLAIFGPAAGTDNVWVLNLGDADEE